MCFSNDKKIIAYILKAEFLFGGSLSIASKECGNVKQCEEARKLSKKLLQANG